MRPMASMAVAAPKVKYLRRAAGRAGAIRAVLQGLREEQAPRKAAL